MFTSVAAICPAVAFSGWETFIITVRPPRLSFPVKNADGHLENKSCGPNILRTGVSPCSPAVTKRRQARTDSGSRGRKLCRRPTSAPVSRTRVVAAFTTVCTCQWRRLGICLRTAWEWEKHALTNIRLWFRVEYDDRTRVSYFGVTNKLLLPESRTSEEKREM